MPLGASICGFQTLRRSTDALMQQCPWNTGALRLPGRVPTDRVPERPAHGTGTSPRTYLYAMAALPGPANGTTSVPVNPALVHHVSN